MTITTGKKEEKGEKRKKSDLWGEEMICTHKPDMGCSGGKEGGEEEG